MIASLLLALSFAASGEAEFGRCVVTADRAGAAALLASEPGSDASRSAVRKWTDKKAPCAATLGKAKLDESGVRGAVAAVLYADAFPAAPAELVGPPAPFQGSGNAKLVKYDIARCAVTRDPVGADMLVRSEAGSAGEKAGFDRVIPAVGRCTPEGAKLGFSKAELRALTAEGLLAFRQAGATN